jgi:CheY-like chemotaxis protein
VPTILVADDNSNIQKMVTLALKELGITVVAVGNGEAAVRKLPDLRPDVVLADIFMPVRNGYEVCEFMKTDERFAHIPVVLLVGAFDPLDEHEVERVHADGVLKKPFVPPDPLIAMVKSLLERGPAPSASASAGPASPTASAMVEPGSAPRMEKTQQLTAAEIASATHQPAPAPEPEPEQFAAPAPPLAIDELHTPVAFREMMGEVEEEEPEEAEEEAEAEEEGEEEEAEPAFEASSVSGLHFPGGIEALPPGATVEASAAPSAPAHEEVVHAPSEAAHEEVDHWAGIKEEQKQPDAEQPPIHVEFGESASVELITDDTRDSMSRIEVRPDPALISSAHEWMSAPTPTVPPPAVEAVEHEPEFEPMRVEAESPAPIAHEAAPAQRPAKSTEDTQEFFAPPVGAEKALETLAQDLHEEAVRATPPPRDMEETQQFMAPAARTPAAAPPEAPSASTWGRVEEVMLPAVPLIAGAAAEFHARTGSAAPAVPEPEIVHEPAHFESAPPAAVVAPGTGVGGDQLIAAITQKVIEQLDPKTIEKLSRELVRPLIEALIRREIDKD